VTTIRPFLGLSLLLVLVLSAAAPVLAGDTRSFLGHWEGAIVLPSGKMGIKVDLARDGEILSGTIDIPDNGAVGIPLDGFGVVGSAITFTIKGVPGDPTFHGKLVDGSINGEFSQYGGSFPFNLGREEIGPPQRPQEPQPPFPYDEEEVVYANCDIVLAGTLTLPPGNGKSPAALLITGSGAQDRDQALFGHKTFMVIADHLTRAGIAVLRVDDRGIGGSTGSITQSTTADFAEDVLAGIAFLMDHDRIDADQIGLIGHSEGGLVAPLVASQSDDVAFVVMLAGPGVPGREVLIFQLELIARSEGIAPETIDRQLGLQRKLLDLLASDGSDAEIEAPFREIVAEQIELSIELSGGGEDTPREAMIDMAVKKTLNPWYRYFVTYDPRPALTRVSVPVLALNGSLDLQVNAEQNLPEIEKALASGANEDYTIEIRVGLNHLFQTTTTGSLSEYAQIEETFEPETLALITAWILERVSAAR